MLFAQNKTEKITKNLIIKYRQKHPDQGKESRTDALKTALKKIKETREATGNLTGNNIADNITKV